MVCDDSSSNNIQLKMANFNNMEIASAVAAHSQISIKKSFFGLFTKVYYKPTLSLVNCIRDYYTAATGHALQQFLLDFQENPSCAEHRVLKMEPDPNGNYCLEMCVAKDGSFIAIQLFRYSMLSYNAVCDIKIFEGHHAALLKQVLVSDHHESL